MFSGASSDTRTENLCELQTPRTASGGRQWCGDGSWVSVGGEEAEELRVWDENGGGA
jgi:hypothetical protein